MHDTIETLTTSAWQLRDEDKPRSLCLAKQAYELATTPPGYPEGKAQSLILYAYTNYRENNYANALEKSFKALNILKTSNHKLWLARLYNTLGIIHNALGDNVTGASYLLKQLELGKELGDKHVVAMAYHDLAVCCRHNNGLVLMNEHLSKARALFHDVEDDWGEALVLLNQAVGFYNEEAYEAALTHIEQALALFEAVNRLRGQVWARNVLGKVLVALGRYEEAQAHLEAGVAIADACAEPKQRLFLNLGVLYMHWQKPEDALPYLQEALNLSTATQNKEDLIKVNHALASFYKQQGDHQKSLEYFEAFHTLKASFFSEESERKMQALTVVHRTELAQFEALQERQRSERLEHYVKELEALHEELSEMSVRDALTGLYNQRHFHEQFARLLEQAQRYDRPLSIAMIDVDEFKAVNETFSYQVGDSVLMQLTHMFKASLRGADVLARYGGEEFVLLMPETLPQQAIVACERLRLSVAQYDWQQLHPGLRVTVSIGIAARSASETSHELIHYASEQLYYAKRSGRNRSCSGCPQEISQ